MFFICFLSPVLVRPRYKYIIGEYTSSSPQLKSMCVYQGGLSVRCRSIATLFWSNVGLLSPVNEVRIALLQNYYVQGRLINSVCLE